MHSSQSSPAKVLVSSNTTTTMANYQYAETDKDKIKGSDEPAKCNCSISGCNNAPSQKILNLHRSYRCNPTAHSNLLKTSCDNYRNGANSLRKSSYSNLLHFKHKSNYIHSQLNNINNCSYNKEIISEFSESERNSCNSGGDGNRNSRSNRTWIESFKWEWCKINSIMMVLIYVLLLCAGTTLARPNNTVSSSTIAAATRAVETSTPSEESNQETTWSVIGSMDHAMQLKKAEDLTKMSSTTEEPPATEIIDTPVVKSHIVSSYPIIQFEFDRVQNPVIIGIWILSASIAKIGFHKSPKLNRIFPESCLLIVIGVIIGVILLFGTRFDVSPLTPNTFFLYMLPPIILDAGYFMPNRLFFDNLGTILLMAVVGTIFNIATIGSSLWACGVCGVYGVETPILDIFLFASLISAVDPVAVLAVFEEIHVNEILYIVVFGESLLNDAVTVVLYHMCEVYSDIGIDKISVTHMASGAANFLVVALGGTVIGVIWGFLTGLVTRYTDNVRVIEPIFIFVMAYLAYLNAELFHMSGILAITFCGITMKNYVEANISQKSHTTIKYALKMLSSSSETIIFMFLGVATVNNRHDWNTWFILLTIIFCSVYRALGVVILTALANKFRLHKLSKVDQFVMSYGGLRGAVAFALVLLINKDHVKLQPMFVTTTIAVIYFTVFLQGITIKPLVKFLNVERASKKKPTMNERIHERFIDHLMAGVEDIVGKTGNYNVRDKFKRFDNKFIRPLLIRNLQGAEPKILETYSKLAMKDAMDYMRRNPSTIGQMSGTESMSALFRNYTGVLGGRCGTSFVNQCPSFSNLENCSRNLDMQELDYNPSKKDLTDAKIHHLLAEELKPYKRASVNMHRRLSYSRHAVDDRDLSTQQVNYKLHMNIRRMNDRKHHKRSKRGSSKESNKQNHVSFPELKQNGSAKQLSNDYINEVLNEATEDDDKHASHPGDDWDDGLTFTARASLGEKSDNIPIPGDNESTKRLSRDSEGETTRVTTPTAIESQLPWKRDEEEGADGGAIKQNEFPAWASNKEYIAYNSPSATFLGGLSKPRQVKSVIGLFRRESSGSQSCGDAGSDPALAGHLTVELIAVTRTPTARPSDRRSASICAVAPISEASENGSDPLGALMGEEAAGKSVYHHASPFAQTASHRRHNNRRASLLELNGSTIPEELYSKSLPEREKRGRAASLLPKLTPKAQNRRHQHHHQHPQAASLLSSSSCDSEEDDDEYHDKIDDNSDTGDTTKMAHI